MDFGVTGGGKTTALKIEAFGGVNRRSNAGAGEWADMNNLRSDEYPCLSPSCGRDTVFTSGGDIECVAPPVKRYGGEPDGITGIVGGYFHYDGVKYSDYYMSPDLDWEINVIGNLYIINGYGESMTLPQLYIFNTDNKTLSYSSQYLDDLIVCAGEDSNGTYLLAFDYEYPNVYSHTYYDENKVLKKNSDYFKKYFSGYVMPSTNIFSEKFSVGDELIIRGFPDAEDNTNAVWSYNSSSEKVLIQSAVSLSCNNTLFTDNMVNLDSLGEYDIVRAEVKSFASTSRSIYSRTTYMHYMYVTLYNKNGKVISFDTMDDYSPKHYCSGITVYKYMHAFDHTAVHQGRLWGTSPTGIQLYASASDDITSFTSNDIMLKFAARLVSDTPSVFKRIISTGDELVAFKDNSIMVVYGTNPNNFVSRNIYNIGCVDTKSIVVTQKGVIFLSHDGFCLYDGTDEIKKLSEVLNKKFVSASAGTDGRKYYAAVTDSDGVCQMLVYDTRYGTWHIEDSLDAVGYFRYLDKFYLADKNTVYALGNSSAAAQWYAVSPRLFGKSFDLKAIREIWVRAEFRDDARLSVWVAQGNDEFSECAAFNRRGFHVLRVPVRAIKSDSFKIKLSGTGNILIYGLEIICGEGGRQYQTGG